MAFSVVVRSAIAAKSHILALTCRLRSRPDAEMPSAPDEEQSRDTVRFATEVLHAAAKSLKKHPVISPD